jgi:hypothetical protein
MSSTVDIGIPAQRLDEIVTGLSSVLADSYSPYLHPQLSLERRRADVPLAARDVHGGIHRTVPGY